MSTSLIQGRYRESLFADRANTLTWDEVADRYQIHRHYFKHAERYLGFPKRCVDTVCSLSIGWNKSFVWKVAELDAFDKTDGLQKMREGYLRWRRPEHIWDMLPREQRQATKRGYEDYLEWEISQTTVSQETSIAYGHKQCPVCRGLFRIRGRKETCSAKCRKEYTQQLIAIGRNIIQLEKEQNNAKQSD